MNTNNQDIVNLVEILAQLGLRHAVISPGSRNAPLIKGFNQHPSIKCYSVVDERSAAFFGLGMAQQLREPVALICTSGSALLNYGPAVVEAYHQQVPLLIISADRPIEWIGQGDGQAIDQKKVFQNFSKGYFELKESRGHKNSAWHNERSVAEAYNLAGNYPYGPVHLNIPLSEPLYGMDQLLPTLTSKPTKSIQSEYKAPAASIAELAKQINSSKKVMVLIGQHHPDAVLAKQLHKLSQLDQVTVLTETTANLFGNGFIDQIDNALATISEEEKEAHSPDLLITLGGMVVTKRLKQFLRTSGPDYHWHLEPSVKHTDTYQHLSHHLQALPVNVLEALLPQLQANSAAYKSLWQQKKQQAMFRHQEFCATANFCDLTVFKKILSALPANSMLQIGNSTPIRYVQLFENKSDITHFCNRGVSGIDGCTSTAAGAAVASGKRTTLISGELSFQYDTNGLWNRYIPDDFLAIVINNEGGSIFRIIDGPDQFSEMPEFIEATHQHTMEPLAEMYGFRYLKADDSSSLEIALNEAFSSGKKTILEVFTPRTESPAILKKYWRFLKEG